MSAEPKGTMQGFNLGAAKEAVAREDDGVRVHLKDASNVPLYWGDPKKPKPVVIVVAGEYSSTYRRAEEALAARKARSSETFYQAAREEALEKAVSCVLDWEGVFDADGKALPCEKTKVRDVLRSYPWVQAQVSKAIYDHAGFFESA